MASTEVFTGDSRTVSSPCKLSALNIGILKLDEEPGEVDLESSVDEESNLHGDCEPDEKFDRSKYSFVENFVETIEKNSTPTRLGTYSYISLENRKGSNR